MYKAYLFLLLFYCIHSYVIAQYREETPKYEPRNYYFDPAVLQMINKDQVGRNIDSIIAVTKIDSLYQLYYQLNIDKDRYAGVEFDFGWQFCDMNTINRELRQLGFDPLRDNMLSFGYGVPFKSNRILHAYLINILAGSDSEKDGVTISANKVDLKALVGYNLTSSVQGVDLFPFIGLSFGGTNISFEKNDWKDIDYLDLNALSSNYNYSSIDRTELDYTVGVQLDGFGATSEGLGLGLRIAYAHPIVHSRWKREGERISYTNDMRMGTISFTLILKIVKNRPFKAKDEG